MEFGGKRGITGTLDELHSMIGDRHTWDMAHGLFHRIRKKTLAAEKREDKLAESQYLFEEACAKTLANPYRQARRLRPEFTVLDRSERVVTSTVHEHR